MLRASPCLQTIPLPEQNVPVSFKSFLLRASTCSESLAMISAICSVRSTQLQPQSSKKKHKKKFTEKIESLTLNDNEQKWKDVAVFLAERVQQLSSVLSKFEKEALGKAADP
ncbi:hypothetical protein KM043_014957 [Ampulex compressa]|nr:hypothetical protein KM043_014957 [Ampulex compressa]